MLETFRESQKAYRDFMAGMQARVESLADRQLAPAPALVRLTQPVLQNIDIPLEGDDAAIKKYASQVEALKRKVRSVLRSAYAVCCSAAPNASKGAAAVQHSPVVRMRAGCQPAQPLTALSCVQVGMPSMEEVISAGLDHKMAMAGYNVRKFLSLAQEGVDLGSYQGIVDQVGQVGVAGSADSARGLLARLGRRGRHAFSWEQTCSVVHLQAFAIVGACLALGSSACRA